MQLKLDASLLPIIAAVLSMALGSCARQTATSDTGTARVTVWAWDAPNDLRFLASSGETVALYAGTIMLGDETAYFKPNEKLTQLPPGQKVFPSFRIESRSKVRNGSVVELTVDAPTTAQVEGIVAIVSSQLVRYERDRSPTVQIDFDATEGERNFYKVLLKKMREKLGPRVRISVTALASWCLGDRWLTREYADEAVVMLFSMGQGQSQIMRPVL